MDLKFWNILDPMPRIIFTTEHTGDYALKAFEVNAVDYLLKPYDRKRFVQAIQKVIYRSAKSNNADGKKYCHIVIQQSKETGRLCQTRLLPCLERKIISVQCMIFYGLKPMEGCPITHQ